MQSIQVILHTTISYVTCHSHICTPRHLYLVLLIKEKYCNKYTQRVKGKLRGTCPVCTCPVVFSLFSVKKFFSQNTRKSLPHIAGSPHVKQFFDLSHRFESTGLQKFSKKNFFLKNMFYGFSGSLITNVTLVFKNFQLQAPQG